MIKIYLEKLYFMFVHLWESIYVPGLNVGMFFDGTLKYVFWSWQMQ